ncbi:MAG: glycine cleavage system protein R [Burkholderiales bacterium]|nr:glycine cleavage system protein R [Burkholderiales bacterium]
MDVTAAKPSQFDTRTIAMLTSLVITVIGPDRPGIVSAVSDKAVEFGANWTDSVMANFAGQFAGIVQLQVAAAHCEALMAALRSLESPGMRIAVAKGGAGGDANATATAARHLMLDLVGNDRPGIIHSISSQLAQRGVSIEKLQTEVVSGAWSGEQMFQMKALLLVPAALDVDALRAGLEGLANELMVDITIDDGQGV